MVDIMPGKVYSMFVGLGNSLRGLIDADKITFLLLYTNPTQKEMADFAATTSIQVRLFTKSEMFFTLKFGTFPWMDSSYTPHLGVTHLQAPPAGGYKMQIALINSMNGRIESVLTSQLPYAFSQKVYDASEEARQRPWDEVVYNQHCYRIMDQYSSSQLASASAIRCTVPCILMETLEATPQSRPSIADIAHSPYQGEPLPKELEPFACYIPDSGNCILCIPECLLTEAKEDGDLNQFEVPVPYRYVLAKGYRMIENNQFVVCDVKYDNMMGVVVPPEYEDDYDEYDYDEGDDDDI